MHYSHITRWISITWSYVLHYNSHDHILCLMAVVPIYIEVQITRRFLDLNWMVFWLTELQSLVFIFSLLLCGHTLVWSWRPLSGIHSKLGKHNPSWDIWAETYCLTWLHGWLPLIIILWLASFWLLLLNWFISFITVLFIY